MRILLQIVQNASVTIDNQPHSAIQKGYLLLVSFTEGDDEAMVRKMADKLVKLRIFPDENGKTNLSLAQVNGQILSVSQFTLYANLKEGNRPSFVNALKGEFSKPLYDYFNSYLADTYHLFVSTGVFGADMKVALVNDGPFTVMLDSKELFQ